MDIKEFNLNDAVRDGKFIIMRIIEAPHLNRHLKRSVIERTFKLLNVICNRPHKANQVHTKNFRTNKKEVKSRRNRYRVLHKKIQYGLRPCVCLKKAKQAKPNQRRRGIG